MWGDSMKDVNCTSARITYEDFVLLMKGQTRDFETDGPVIARSESGQRLNGALLHAVNEVDEAEINLRSNKSRSNSLVAANPVAATAAITTPRNDLRSIKSFSPHLTPVVSNLPINDSPLSMDDNDGMRIPLSLQFPVMPTFTTPPTSPKRVASNYMSSVSESKTNPRTVMDEAMANTITSDPEPNNIYSIPDIPKPGAIYVRMKSRSFDEREMTEMKKSFEVDSRRAVALPEHDPEKRKLIVNDNIQLTTLQVNRKLYRSHRQMRLSVIDACKRFEEHQTKYAHGVLLALEKEKSMASSAGLVMRRVENKTVSSEEVKSLLEKNRKEHQDLVEKANRRGGGRRSRRKKTVSDLSTMMGSLSSEEMTKISMQASGPAIKRINENDVFEAPKEPFSMIPPVIETKPLENPENLDDDDDLRRPTVPGEFRKVKDPFGSHGKYAAMMGTQ